MTKDQLNEFREKIAKDTEYNDCRERFRNNYEDIEAIIGDRRNLINNVAQKANQNKLWEQEGIKSAARKLCCLTPVGNKDRGFEAGTNILRATYFLRHHTGLFDKWDGFLEDLDDVNEIEIGSHWKGKDPILAVLTIVKQIRDNLFHGGKVQLENKVYERNKVLICLASEILDIVLKNIN
ncbi:hypothetical protein GCM10009122_00420 [Fulvivirga kasyanovii]|uniref:RiboL-PSP-HEPN domain-containing protein n=1 Tax=Fulvivirga kasyanovii TaxID=396812 RepID=A0ABW9RRE3_9BACT|nr:hypothetical protein [Fulvivirga kasyanovii]MTI25595.1 hypothetical protein [Fulvivirga kasyanovii]